jgi:oxygen-dependent protoporphyrinogen oxidase
MSRRRVVVVGGGVAGLAAAFRIDRSARSEGLDVEVQLLEAEAHSGGKIGTVRESGFLCETGPNGFLDNEPATLRLVHDLGLDDRLQRSEDSARRRYLVRQGRLVEMHMHPVKFLRSPLLSRGAKLRMGLELWKSPRTDGADESVGQFGRRRLGAEFTEIMLDSMVSGIYAGDVDRLSVKAAFPKVVEMEQRYGGLFKALFKRNKERRQRRHAHEAAVARGEEPPGTEESPVQAGPAGVLHSFREGMGEAIDGLHRALGDRVRCGVRVTDIERSDEGAAFRLRLHGAEDLEADGIVLAVPAPQMSALLRGLADEAAEALAEIPIAGVHVVCLGLRLDQVDHDLVGFGALIPRREGIRTLGAIFSSSTFEGRAPEDHALLTCMIGGRHDPAANALDDGALLRHVIDDVRPLLGIRGEPAFVRVFRWAQGIPQYEIGHLERVRRAREDVQGHRGLLLGGNSIAGVSFNQCIAHAEALAEQMLEHLRALEFAGAASQHPGRASEGSAS